MRIEQLFALFPVYKHSQKSIVLASKVMLNVRLKHLMWNLFVGSLKTAIGKSNYTVYTPWAVLNAENLERVCTRLAFNVVSLCEDSFFG